MESNEFRKVPLMIESSHKGKKWPRKITTVCSQSSAGVNLALICAGLLGPCHMEVFRVGDQLDDVHLSLQVLSAGTSIHIFD